jgi:diguanylate cyclase (GGDEF)-like protein/PAS domain S-box-containing protein
MRSTTLREGPVDALHSSPHLPFARLTHQPPLAMSGTDLVDYRALFVATPASCLVLTRDLMICEVNDAYLQATNRRREELVGRHVFDAFPSSPSDPDANGVRNLRVSLERARDTGQADAVALQRYDIPKPAGHDGGFEERYWSAANMPVLGPDGCIALIIHHVEDVTETFRAQHELALRERRFRALVEDASDLILVVSADREITYASPSVQRVLGDGAGRHATAVWGDLAHPDDRATALSLLARAQAEPSETVDARFRALDGHGAIRWMDAHARSRVADPAISGIIITIRDVTEQCAAETTLQRQALQDPLTGMPNRRWFTGAVRQALARAARARRLVGLAVVDVDDFKRVNDSFGHPAGDRLLVALSERMSATLRPGDSVARLGGDEFVVLAEDLHRQTDVLTVARRVVDAASGRYDVGPDLRTGVTLSVGASTGGGGVDADALFSQADAALYEAKRAGRNRISLFDPAMQAHLRRRRHVEHELHRALDAQQFVLHWQPIVGARDGRTLGAEALIRWRHRQRGLLGPAQFLPIAEEAGLMPQICAWVLDQAMTQAARWKDFPTHPQVFLNLAAEQLSQPELVDRLSERSSAHGVDPARVRLEISERLLTSNIDATSELIIALRRRGFGVALDDFGAGNTSLAWLRQLPLDVLKLDRAFTIALAEPATRAIVSSLTRLAPALGLTSLAEGVETAEQLETLAELGCDYAQGYHLSRPVPADQVTELLASGGAGLRR